VESHNTTNAQTSTADDPSPEQIYLAEEWSRSALGVTKPDSLWQLQMALVFRGLSRRDNAEERCRQALSLDPLNWRASHLLAKLVTSHQEAIQILKNLMNRLENDRTWMEAHQRLLAEMAFDLGTRYWDIEQFDAAIKTYSKCVQHDPTDHRSTLGILSRYRSREQWNDILDFVETLRSIRDKSPLSAMAIAHTPGREFDEIILQTAVRTRQFNVFDHIYKDAIQSALQNQAYNASFLLRYFYARALSTVPNRPIDKVRELLETAVRDDLPRATLNAPALFFAVGDMLGKIYLAKAREAKDAGDNQLAMEFLNKMTEIVPEQVPEWQLLLPPCLFGV
jgi:tetratricopeptide (TPR) repeat protein